MAKEQLNATHQLLFVALMLVLPIVACAAPSSAPSNPRPSPPSAPQIQSMSTPRPAPISPPTRIPIPTKTPASPVPSVQSGFAQVDMGDYFFYPDVVTVTVGTTVRWNHVGTTGHDVTAEDHSWGIAAIPMASYYEYKFTRPGVYPYLCNAHRPGMTGVVVVVKQ